MSEIIQNNKYVELAYRVIDQKSGEVLVAVEFPIGYVHGANDMLMSSVTDRLAGKAAGAIIDAPFNGDQVFGARDESLVYTDDIENVPEEYRKIGTTVIAENDKGETLSFIVTRMDDKTLTIDGNHPLCGREVVFKLEILKVRDATEEEIQAGGPIGGKPDIKASLLMPL
ncbi:MAG: peptidylprolyl isomerase [Proteobacteria bacterium]|nr:peptidylprolyl isomerase [Pseudomonadota bacterium]